MENRSADNESEDQGEISEDLAELRNLIQGIEVGPSEVVVQPSYAEEFEKIKEQLGDIEEQIADPPAQDSGSDEGNESEAEATVVEDEGNESDAKATVVEDEVVAQYFIFEVPDKRACKILNVRIEDRTGDGYPESNPDKRMDADDFLWIEIDQPGLDQWIKLKLGWDLRGFEQVDHGTAPWWYNVDGELDTPRGYEKIDSLSGSLHIESFLDDEQKMNQVVGHEDSFETSNIADILSVTTV
jgi:hypothetical protein